MISVDDYIPEPNTGCWLWLKGLSSDGYGKVKRNSKTVRAHRLSYELANGAIPSTSLVLHSCDQPSCVNPEHLRIGTAQDNADDRRRRNRHAKGPKSGMAKLTVEQVAFIRDSTISNNAEVARQLSISRHTVREIRKYITWK